MGTPDFAVPILKSLAESNHNILQVYTKPPRKKNRGLKIIPSPIHELSNKISVDVNDILHIKTPGGGGYGLI